MLKRADSTKRAGAQGGPTPETRHRRLASTRHRPHSRGRRGASWLLKLVVPFVGIGSLGLLAMVTVYTVTRLDSRKDVITGGFSYGDGRSRRGNGGDYLGGDPLRNPTFRSNRDEAPAVDAVSKNAPRNINSSDNRFNPNIPHLQDSRRPPPPLLPHQPSLDGPSGNAESDRDDRKKDDGTGNKKSFERSTTTRVTYDGGGSGRGGGGKEGGIRKKAMGGWKGGVTIHASTDINQDVEAGVSDRVLEGSEADFAGGARGQEDALDKPDIIDGGARDYPARGRDVWNEAPLLGRDAALLIICANRPEYLRRTLNAVAKHYPPPHRGKAFAMPVVISQDGSDQNVEAVISQFKTSMAELAPVIHIHHDPSARERRGYFKLSAHYKWALSQAFDELHVDDYNFALVHHVIILEEDLEIAPDFFEFFSAMAPLLDSDETLMAASAWNDNGQASHVKDNQAVVRTDFFPGLGWMLPRRVWNELSADWPAAYWDDWLREPQRRRNRQFIRPEVCRTFHFGKKGGASNNQFAPHLDNIKLSDGKVPFRKLDLSYLKPDAFRVWFLSVVSDAPVVSVSTVMSGSSLPTAIVIEYDGDQDFEAIAKGLGVMWDIKAGVPRTAYMGIVTFWYKDTEVYIAPK